MFVAEKFTMLPEQTAPELSEIILLLKATSPFVMVMGVDVAVVLLKHGSVVLTITSTTSLLINELLVKTEFVEV